MVFELTLCMEDFIARKFVNTINAKNLTYEAFKVR
jgi:hypothetical protein